MVERKRRWMSLWTHERSKKTNFFQHLLVQKNVFLYRLWIRKNPQHRYGCWGFLMQRFLAFIAMSANRIRPRLQQKKPHCCGLFCSGFVFSSFSVLLRTSHRRCCRVLPQRHILCKKHRLAWQLAEKARKLENGLPGCRTQAHSFGFFLRIDWPPHRSPYRCPCPAYSQENEWPGNKPRFQGSQRSRQLGHCS